MKFSRRSFAVLILFGLIGQIAWSVENMFFNLFIFDTMSTADTLSAITVMVQASGVVATLVTLIAGTLSDKIGNRKRFISIGYLIWGFTVAVFGFISPGAVESIFKVEYESAVKIALITAVAFDCIMTFFGSAANDAAFNAWVTDNTTVHNRGRVESIISILPLIAMLIVTGGFGILVNLLSYSLVFFILGIVISGCGVIGIFLIRDSERLEKNGGFRDILYGFKPSSIISNKPFYINLIIVCIYGIACQIFMPYMVIYMKSYLRFSELEYSLIFGAVILVGALINLLLGRVADRIKKSHAMYIAAGAFALGLLLMYFSKGMSPMANRITFGISGLIMITGYIFISALTGATARDYTPDGAAGKLQGVRMIFSVLIPMLAGPAIGNAINKTLNIPLENAGADAMTTSYVPAPQIFLAASLSAILIFAMIPILAHSINKHNSLKETNI